MIGLDTNVVVRLLTGDDAAQQCAAAGYLKRNSSSDDPAWINRIVAVETVWVLESCYRYSRVQIADAIERLLDTAEIAFEDHDLVRTAARSYARGVGFSDTLIALGNAARCSTTLTFDAKAARRCPAMTLL